MYVDSSTVVMIYMCPEGGRVGGGGPTQGKAPKTAPGTTHTPTEAQPPPHTNARTSGSCSAAPRRANRRSVGRSGPRCPSSSSSAPRPPPPNHRPARRPTPPAPGGRGSSCCGGPSQGGVKSVNNKTHSLASPHSIPSWPSCKSVKKTHSLAAACSRLTSRPVSRQITRAPVTAEHALAPELHHLA